MESVGGSATSMSFSVEAGATVDDDDDPAALPKNDMVAVYEPKAPR